MLSKSPFLFFVALFSTVFTLYTLTDPDLLDFALISAPCALASAVLILRARSKTVAPKKTAIVDGSNIMYWRDGEPGFEPLHDVINTLKSRGYRPGVMFDANVGYLLVGHYMDDREMARKLNLPLEAVLVVAKGTPADEVILNAARKLGATVITNDRYRDWEQDFPEISNPGFLVRGGYGVDGIWLDFDAEQSKARASARRSS